MSVTSTLFPPANREAATVAFVRTFWQTVRAVATLTITGGVVVTANQLATVDWLAVGYGAAAIVLSGVLAGALAAGDVLTRGLPAAYVANAIAAPAPLAPVVPPAALPAA